jgi:hypothetical protein
MASQEQKHRPVTDRWFAFSLFSLIGGLTVVGTSFKSTGGGSTILVPGLFLLAIAGISAWQGWPRDVHRMEILMTKEAAGLQ